MKSAVNWFEIPVTDMIRAKKFYEHIFKIQMNQMTLGNGLVMAMFPVEGEGIGGALCLHSKSYQPSKEGVLIYLNANPVMADVLRRIVDVNGEVLIAQSKISPEFGSMALIIDSEGNRIALHSDE